MNMYNILIVEDEFINAHFIEQAIIKLGHNVVAIVECSAEAMKIVKEENIHIVFMDINLSGAVDGISCAKLINKHKKTPIIYTTAFSDSKTIDEATHTNLYGYIIKPFDYHDIEATLALTIKLNYVNQKRTKNANAHLFTLLGDKYKYYAKTKTLINDETSVKLTKKESEIFYYLFKSLNQTVSTEYLMNYVWDNKAIASSTIRDTIFRLRKKIPNLKINTVSGIGYVLETR